MYYRTEKNNKKKKILLMILFLLVGIGGYFSFVKFESEKPSFHITPEPKFLGKYNTFEISCEDRRSGIKEVKMDFIQDDRLIPLIIKNYSPGTKQIIESIEVNPPSLGLKEGSVTLHINVKDYSWKPGRNTHIEERSVFVDMSPPSISVLSRFHYINQGGTGLIVYFTSEKLAQTGVKAGGNWFQGFEVKDGIFLSFFAVPHDAAEQTSVVLDSKDLAGNQTLTRFPYSIKPKKFQSDIIYLDDGFLRKIMPYFTDRDSSLTGDLEKIFLKVNQNLRESNSETIRKLCLQSIHKILWAGTFLRLQNAETMSHFGVQRDYFYRGNKIDSQYHLGVDLASSAKSPVKAANHGKVVFADELGIYGKTILLDHGCGLFTLYGHLNQIGVQADQTVEKGSLIGTTGTTGMAGGDHLHFSVLVSGVFVNPIEWWDPHWIKDNIESKLELVRLGEKACQNH